MQRYGIDSPVGLLVNDGQVEPIGQCWHTNIPVAALLGYSHTLIKQSGFTRNVSIKIASTLTMLDFDVFGTSEHRSDNPAF